IRDFHVTGVQTCALPISGVMTGAGSPPSRSSRSSNRSSGRALRLFAGGVSGGADGAGGASDAAGDSAGAAASGGRFSSSAGGFCCGLVVYSSLTSIISTLVFQHDAARFDQIL